MINRKECPECKSWDTERVHTEWATNMVQEVRVCNDCRTQYAVEYGNPRKTNVRTEE